MFIIIFPYPEIKYQGILLFTCNYKARKFNCSLCFSVKGGLKYENPVCPKKSISQFTEKKYNDIIYSNLIYLFCKPKENQFANLWGKGGHCFL